VAAWLVGNTLPLTKVVQQLWQQLQTQDASSSQSEASLRNCVIDLATRKSFGVKGGKQTTLHIFLMWVATMMAHISFGPPTSRMLIRVDMSNMSISTMHS